MRWPWAAALVVGAIVTLGLVWWIGAGDRRLAREARAALAGRRLDEAGRLVDRWLAARPGSAEAHALKARLELALDQPGPAMEHVRRAAELGQPAAELDRLRGIILARAGRHAEAEPLLRAARAASDGPDAELSEALARVYLETFRFRPAAEAIARWARESPRDPRPHLWQAEVDRRTEADPETIADDFRRALRLDPDLAPARLGLADALRRGSKAAEALKEYEQYLKLKGDDAEGRFGAGQAALDAGDVESAARHLDRALELSPNHLEALRARAALAQSAGDLAGALGWLDRAVVADPHDPETRYRRSRVLAQLGRQDEARAERATEARLRREADEMKRIKDGLVRAPGDRTLQLEAARWLIDHGHEEEGIAWARKVAAERPDDPEANRLLADYHDRKGDRGLANFYRGRAAGR